MSQRHTLLQQLEAFEQGTFLDDRCFYFYDWFCKNASLRNKAKQLLPKAKKFAALMNIDACKVYVIFKNNCPWKGRLYDDFRICDIETGDVLYTVVPACGHDGTRNECCIWSHLNNFQEPWKQAISWNSMVHQLKHS